MNKEQFEKWIEDVFIGFKTRYEELHESPWSKMPHENNLMIDIVSLSAAYGYQVFTECHHQGQRRDVLILNKDEKWVMQIELKHVYYKNSSDIKEISDIDRILDENWLTTYISDTLRPKLDIQNYKTYGLFIGIGHSWMYKWWLAMSSDAQKQNLLVHGPELEAYYNELQARWSTKNTQKGLLPRGIDSDQLWLLYFLRAFA